MHLLSLIPRLSTWPHLQYTAASKCWNWGTSLSLSVASFIQVLAIQLGDGKGFGIANKIGDQLILHHAATKWKYYVIRTLNCQMCLFLLLVFFSLTDSVTFALSVDWQISRLLSWTVTNLVHILFSLRCRTCKPCGWTETISPIFLFSLRKLPPVFQTWGTSLCWTMLRFRTTSMEGQNRSMKTTGITWPSFPDSCATGMRYLAACIPSNQHELAMSLVGSVHSHTNSTMWNAWCNLRPKQGNILFLILERYGQVSTVLSKGFYNNGKW